MVDTTSIKIELKKCPICKDSEWQSLDYLRDREFWYKCDYLLEGEPVGMKLCKNCGFVTYDYRDMTKLQRHYDEERPMMSSQNIITCNRKNEYHKKFLDDTKLFGNQAIPDKALDIQALDVGCAQGAYLDMLHTRYNVPKDNLHGTEWSQAFRDWGRFEYGINKITIDIDETKTYDFISYYHVLEHVQHPDKELDKIRNMLSDDGYLYISVPVWFENCEEASGSNMVTFENYYHLNHIDVFSKQSIQNLLKTKGFKIIKEDDMLYGYTVLCQKCEPSDEIITEDWITIKKSLEVQKQAISLLQTDPLKAIELVPKFPDAYIIASLQKETMKELKTQEELIYKGLKECPGNHRLRTRLGQLYYQWDENTPNKNGYYGNNLRKSEKILKELAEERPGQEDNFYFLALINGRYKKNYDEAVYWMRKVIKINPSKWADITKYIATFWRDKGCDMEVYNIVSEIGNITSNKKL